MSADMFDVTGALAVAAIFAFVAVLNNNPLGNGWVGVKKNAYLAICGGGFFFIAGMLGQLIWAIISPLAKDILRLLISWAGGMPMSTLFLLLIAAWVALITVAFVAACAQAAIHLLPPITGRWQVVPRVAPTLAEQRTHL